MDTSEKFVNIVFKGIFVALKLSKSSLERNM